jgi:hypothetical protein
LSKSGQAHELLRGGEVDVVGFFYKNADTEAIVILNG